MKRAFGAEDRARLCPVFCLASSVYCLASTVCSSLLYQPSETCLKSVETGFS